jgi:hypothetical protein
MANNEDKLSRLYREGLGDFAKDPPPQVWSGVKHGLLIRNLITFKFMTSLNIYSVSVFIAAAAIIGFFAGKGLQQKHEIASSAIIRSAIVNNLPEKTERIQNFNQEQSNVKQEQNIQTTNTSIKHDIIKKQTIDNKSQAYKVYQTPVHSNIIPDVNNPTVKNESVNNTVNNPTIQKDITIKSAEQTTKKPAETTNLQKDETKKLASDKTVIPPNNNPPKQTPPDQTKKQSDSKSKGIIPRKPKTTQGFYADIFGAPAIFTYKYDQSTVNPNLAFVNTSKGEEKPSLSYTAGLELGYGFKHYFAQTGVNYSDYRSSSMIDLVNSYLIRTYDYKKKDSIFLYQDSSGHKYYNYTYDTITVNNTIDTLTSHRSTNSLRYIEIPILFGYRYYGKRMSYALSTGLSLGYLSSSGGQTLNPDLKSITINTTDAVPLKKWTYYFVLRVEAAYLLNKDLCVFIRPGFKYNMNSVFEEYYPVQKTFYALDLHLGLRYIF